MRGIIFSIEEFAVFDGEGIRVNVFFKGCPLRCQWCHNPEGWKKDIQIVKNPNGCIECGICSKICPSPEKCLLCKTCVYNCPMGLIRTSGQEIEAVELAKHLKKYESILKESGGGLTFSGGEVLSQADFLCEVLDKTSSMHRAVETSGYGDSQKWKDILKRLDFVYYDLKIMDDVKHIKYTGVSNKRILHNAKILFESNVPFVIRVPFIHNVNTDHKNLVSLCEFIKDAKNLVAVEFLDYNELAGAKYRLAGLEYEYEFEKPTPDDYRTVRKVFEKYMIKYMRRE